MTVDNLHLTWAREATERVDYYRHSKPDTRLADRAVEDVLMHAAIAQAEALDAIARKLDAWKQLDPPTPAPAPQPARKEWYCVSAPDADVIHWKLLDQPPAAPVAKPNWPPPSTAEDDTAAADAAAALAFRLGRTDANLYSVLSLIRAVGADGISWTTLCERAYERFGISEAEMDDITPILEDEWGAITYSNDTSSYYPVHDFRR